MKFCASAFKIAWRRSIAEDNQPLSSVNFPQLLREKNQLGFGSPVPLELRGGVALQAHAVAGDVAAGLALLGGEADAMASSINAEWLRFLFEYDNPASELFFNPKFKAERKMCDYWLLVRKGYPNVAAVMPWWLSFVGTAGLERDFSGLTMVTRDSRRRRRRSAATRCLAAA